MKIDDMTDRAILIALHDSIQDIKKRLTHIETNQTLTNKWARGIALSRGADHIVAEIDAHLAEVEVRKNGGA